MKFEFVESLKDLTNRSYWNKANAVEFFAFMTKIVIIVPGLLLGIQFWWLYIFALVSSIALVWTSTVKTLPSIILFNILWICLASTAILNHFFGFLPK
jgi:hypothetical protein